MNRKAELAKQTFAALCSTLDATQWDYTPDAAALTLLCSAKSNDLPIDIAVEVREQEQLIVLRSRLPVSFPTERRQNAAFVVGTVNNSIDDGSFDFNVKTGELFFRMSNSFMESELSGETFRYLLLYSCRVIDVYNDRFLMLSKGVIGINAFFEAKKKGKAESNRRGCRAGEGGIQRSLFGFGRKGLALL